MEQIFPYIIPQGTKVNLISQFFLKAKLTTLQRELSSDFSIRTREKNKLG